MNLNILVIEDDPIDLISIRAKIRELGYPDPVFTDHKADIQYLLQTKNPQLVISDIYYDKKPLGLGMIDLCKTYNIPLILMTADTRFDTFEMATKQNDVSYLVKPFHHFTLQTCITMLMGNFKTTSLVDDKSLFVKSHGNKKVRLNYTDILFLEADGNSCYIHCLKEKFIIRTSLTKLQTELDDRFVQIHKSFTINKNNITKISNTHLYIETNEIPIGRKYRRYLDNIAPSLK